ncbi:MAG: cytochrome c oxidase subunit II [Halorientalis sp.]
MEIHRFEKLWLGAGLLLIVGFIATIAYGAVGAGVGMVGDEGGTVDQAAIAAGNYEGTNFKSPGVRRVGAGNYTVHVVAQQFLFRPGTSEPIRVPAGSRVTFYVTSADVVHGFELVGTNVNSMVIPGQVSQFTVRFEEPGEYGIVCHEYCGAGHHTMAGTVRVLPRSEFNRSMTVGGA